MKLHELKMTNWRSFFGEPPTIHFSTDADTNVTVIHAPNGSGKTNILNALLWLFSGTTSPNFQQPKQLINKQAILNASDGDRVECKVECLFENHGQLHRASRLAWCNRKGTVEASWGAMRESSLQLMFRNDSGGWSEATNPQDMIDAILPPSIRDFFFFDGEELRAKFKHDKKKQEELAKQMQFFFGLGTFLHAQRAMNSAERELRKQAAESGDEELQALSNRKTQLESERDDTLRQKAESIDKASLYAEKADLIESQLSELQEAAALQIERDGLKRQLKQCDTALEKNRKARAREIGEYGYAVFLKTPLEVLESQIKDLENRGELPSDVKRPFIERLLKEQECICGRSLEGDDGARTCVEEWLSKSGLSDVEERVLRMSGQFGQLNQYRDSFWEKLGELQESREELKKQHVLANNRLSQISSSLRDSSVEKIQELENERQELQDKRETEIERQGSLTQKISSLEDTIKKIQADIDVHESRNEAAERARRRQVIASEAATCIEGMFKARDAQMRRDLLERITRRYRELTIKEYEPRLSEEYRLEIVDRSGGSDSLVGLSGGETQVLAFCFVGSIIEIQREHAEQQGLVPTGVDATEYPIVMDSPYGQLSMAYRKTVSEYIPKVTDQVIVLVTDSQWEGATASILREKSGKAYVLKQHATPENLGKHHLSAISLGGREYPFVVPSSTGYEWTEIVEVSHA